MSIIEEKSEHSNPYVNFCGFDFSFLNIEKISILLEEKTLFLQFWRNNYTIVLK